jgi:hypothetical protein
VNSKQSPQQTTAPIAPGKPGKFSKADAEFGRVPDCWTLFGLRRGTIYNLIKDGEIRSVCIRRRGFKQGCRLIDLSSVRSFLTRQLEVKA